MGHALGLVVTQVPQDADFRSEVGTYTKEGACCGGIKDWEGAWGRLQLLDSRGLPEAGLGDKLEVLCNPMIMAGAAQRKARTETGHTQPGRHHDSQL